MNAYDDDLGLDRSLRYGDGSERMEFPGMEILKFSQKEWLKVFHLDKKNV